jgi:hypothetical protein
MPHYVRKCSSNEYGALYELIPPVRYTLRNTQLPNGLETHYDKKHLNWTCSDEDVRILYSQLTDIISSVYRYINRDSPESVNFRHGFRLGQPDTPNMIETQTYPRITSHKIFVHEPGEIFTYGSLTPGFQASEVQIECKHIWTKTGTTDVRVVWYTSSVRPTR